MGWRLLFLPREVWHINMSQVSRCLY